jgi:4-hydroxybenzoate polyprenyltransferase
VTERIAEEGPVSQARAFARTIKLSHSIFALPFALAAAALAAVDHGLGVLQGVWILLAMVAARSAAMGFNRIVDRDIDARNPRTASREIPAGDLSVRSAWGWTVASALIFLGASWALGPLPLLLAPIALAVVWGYSLVKRVSWTCHLVLGLALGLAPVGAWVAIAGSFAVLPVLLAAIVGTWVAGFDIIYSCQDAGFDADQGLHSIPERFGVRRALWISIGLHVLTVTGLAALPFVAGLGSIYWLGFALMAGTLAYEHVIVRPDDLSRVDKAFFDLNGYVSLAFFGTVLVALF